MTTSEFLSFIKSKNAIILPPAAQSDIIMTNTNLQNMNVAMLPKFMLDLYTQCAGANLGSGYIFGPQDFDRGIKYPMPSITKINKENTLNKHLGGKTIFGLNDLFWFAFDIHGNCFMLDNLTLSVLRKYDDPYRAMIDCLIIGKI